MWGRKPTIVVKRYRTEREYQRDATRMARRGYRIVGTVSDRKQRGILWWLTIGIFAFLFPRKAEYVVTYQLEAAR